jgi:hypothetical protein
MSLKKPPRDKVSARIDPDVFELVERIAEVERRPISSVVRNVLPDWASECRTQHGSDATA